MSSTPVRVVDISTETIEILDKDLVTHLLKVIDALKEERKNRLDAAQGLISSVEEAMDLFATFMAGIEPRGKGILFQDAMHHVRTLSERINKLYIYANSFAATAGLSTKCIVKVSLAQAREFGL